MKNLTIIFFATISLNAYSQVVYTIEDIEEYRNIADSLLSIQIDSAFNKGIVCSGAFIDDWHKCMSYEEEYIYDKTPYKERKKYVYVFYSFVDACGQKYGYAKKHSVNSNGFYIVFDFEYKEVCYPEYWLVKEIFPTSNNCYISNEEAQNIAITNSNQKSKKTKYNYLVYDVETKRVCWLISRETKNKKRRDVETLKIDAQTGNVLEKEEYQYYK